jgi:hypothetical protein
MEQITEQLTEQFSRIFEKLETLPLAAVTSTKPLPAIREVWQKKDKDTYVCKLSGRHMTRIEFRTYQDRSKCGPMGFMVEVF